MTDALQPLTCSTCGAPVPLGEGDRVRCPSCNGEVELPAAYQQLRAARALTAEDSAALEEMVRDVATPSPAWKTVMMWVGYVVGGITVVVLAIGALIGAIAGLVGAAKVDAGDTIGAIIIAVCTVGCGLVSVPFVGEVLVHTISRGDLDIAIDLATTGAFQWKLDVAVGLVLYVFAIIPIALARRTQVSLERVDALRAELAAAPATKGGVLGCRQCGAPLTVADGALVARCVYCGADSLVAVSQTVARDAKRGAQTRHRKVDEAVWAWRQTRAADRDLMLKLLFGGPGLVPAVCLGGVLLHALAS